MSKRCNYPKCKCAFDMSADGLCLMGLPNRKYQVVRVTKKSTTITVEGDDRQKLMFDAEDLNVDRKPGEAFIVIPNG